MPSGPPTPALSDRFCKLVKEFVGDMGGGLVILCGPRFGPQQLAKTALADLLPVTVDPAARVRDQEPFKLQLTTQAAGFPFMQLGAGCVAAGDAAGLGQPGALALVSAGGRHSAIGHRAGRASHRHLRATGKKQPLIAIRQYGRGEVVYLGFNETWRLRRAHGEELFRRFWKEVMWRLALNHALGANKRFVVQTDQQRYQVDQTVTLTVQAGNADYKAAFRERGARRQAQRPVGASGRSESQKPVVQPLSLTQVQPGLFSTRFVVTSPGEHRVTRDRSDYATSRSSGPSRPSARRSSGRARSATRPCKRRSPRRAAGEAAI